jgi:hypothetical protein
MLEEGSSAPETLKQITKLLQEINGWQR